MKITVEVILKKTYETEKKHRYSQWNAVALNEHQKNCKWHLTIVHRSKIYLWKNDWPHDLQIDVQISSMPSNLSLPIGFESKKKVGARRSALNIWLCKERAIRWQETKYDIVRVNNKTTLNELNPENRTSILLVCLSSFPYRIKHRRIYLFLETIPLSTEC